MFYLHGGVVTVKGDNAINASVPEWGPYQYSRILDTLRAHGFYVISERRWPGIDDSVYVRKIVKQADTLTSKMNVMKPTAAASTRRNFLRTTAALTAGVTGMTAFPAMALAGEQYVGDGLHIIGPKEGFSPQIGTLVSMMNWMRDTVLRSVKGMKLKQLDYLHDPKSNTIGAMLLHLAATEVFYQGNTFEGLNDFKKSERATWNAAMELGDEGRKTIKGHDLDYYINILTKTREKSLAELRKRDDKWLMTVDPKFFGGQPTNNYCKWFHVVEHESNHNGQIKWIKGRLPGALGGE